jgi:hypothetical protein
LKIPAKFPENKKPLYSKSGSRVTPNLFLYEIRREIEQENEPFSLVSGKRNKRSQETTVIKKALRPSIALLALTLFIAPVSKMYADDPCNIITGCDPVPPPALPMPGLITSIILSMMGLS